MNWTEYSLQKFLFDHCNFKFFGATEESTPMFIRQRSAFWMPAHNVRSDIIPPRARSFIYAKPLERNVFGSMILGFALSTTSPVDSSSITAPSGWRFPTKSDIESDWNEYTKPGEDPPYHVVADLDGNGLKDEAWILLRTKGKGWGVWVFLAMPKGIPKTLLLDESTKEGAQWHGISIASPGEYETACGKGYWDCEKGEPAKLSLKRPAIDFFKFESANSFFVWNKKKRAFDRVWMSD